MHAPDTPASATVHAQTPVLTEEQVQRIAHNKEIALQRRAAREATALARSAQLSQSSQQVEVVEGSFDFMSRGGGGGGGGGGGDSEYVHNRQWMERQ